MKKVVILVLICMMVLLGCESKPTSDVAAQVASSKIEKSIVDLNQLIKAIEDIHPDMYAYTDENNFKRAVENVKNQFEEGTPIEFYKLVAPIVASINDGKTILDPLGNYFTASIENGGNFFPYQIDVLDGALYVKSSYIDDKQIEVDTELLKINEQPAKEVYDNLIRYTSGISISEKEYALTKEFHRLFYMIYGDIEHFTFEIDSQTVEVAGANIENIVLQELPVNKTYSYETLSEGVGLITVNKFNGFSGFKRFIEATFVKLNDENINTLLIDISDNIGGNTEFSKYIMSFITEKPFRLYGDIKAKISEEVKTQDSFMRDHYSDRVGEVISAEFNDETRPYDPEVFSGDIYLLISEKTYSIASELAAAVKHYELATVVGTNTSSNSSSFKAIYSLTSDHHNVEIKIPYRYYLDASGVDLKSSVSPDIEVKENVVEYVLELLSK